MSVREALEPVHAHRAPPMSGASGSAWPRRVAWALLILFLLVPSWWGGDARFPWDNSIAPAAVLKALAAKFRPGFFMTYGPVPYYLTAVPYVAVLGIARVVGELGVPSSAYPYGFKHPEWMMSLLSTVAHLVTAVLALGIVWMSVRFAPGGTAVVARPATGAARRAGGPPIGAAGWLAPILFLGSPIFMYYGRTSNVDVHYLFWLWLGVVLVEQARGSWRVLAGAAASAAMAVCSKEQSAPVAVVIVLAAMWSALRGSAANAPSTFASRIVPALGIGIAAIVAYAIAWRLPWNLEGWRAHHAFLFADATYGRTFPPTLAGYLGLAARAGRQTLHVMGLPMTIGVALAVLTRSVGTGLTLRAIACAAYLAGFLGSIGYTFERFLLPMLLLAAPIAIRGWTAAVERPAPQAMWRPALVALLALTALTGGPALTAVQLGDPRYQAERWIRDKVPPTATIEIAGNPHYQPRVPAGRPRFETKTDSLHRFPRGPIGDVVLVSSMDIWGFESDSLARVMWWDPLRTEFEHGVRQRAVFPRSRLYRFTPGIEVPIITAYVRPGIELPVSSSEPAVRQR